MNILNIKFYIQQIIKKIFQFLFIILYGRVKNILNSKTSNRVEVKKIFKENQSYRIFILNEARLYTDRINDSAFIIDNQIVDGPSYQLRSEPGNILSPRNNSETKNNIVFEKGTPRFKKRIKGSVISLLTGGGGNTNYFHWLYDVLPKLSLYEDLNNKKFPDFLLVPNDELHFQKESLNILGFNKEQILSSKTYRHIISKKIYVTDHPYNITNNALLDHEKMPSWISEWLKKKFLHKIILNNKFEKIYIDRNDFDTKRLSSRGILNEQELRLFLKSLGFKFVKLNEMSFLEQINIFNNAKIIIGLHGAAFANLSFCKPKTRVIEFKTSGAGKIIESIAMNNNLNFSSLELDSQKLDDKQNGFIDIPLNELKNLI